MNSKFEAHGAQTASSNPLIAIFLAALTLRGWADNRLGPVLGGPSRTLPSGNQLPYPAYTSWVSRVGVQFVDAACWQQHVGAALGQAETGRGTSASELPNLSVKGLSCQRPSGAIRNDLDLENMFAHAVVHKRI